MTYLRRYFPVALVLVSGVCASLLGFWQFIQIEETEFERNFVLAASERIVAIERSIQSQLDTVLSIKSFYESSLIVQREQFRTFVAPIFDINTGMKNIIWVPKVPAAEKKDFEFVAKSEGFHDFKFTERTGSGESIAVKPRDFYYPQFYVEPVQANDPLLGFDVGSSESRLIDMEVARDTGRVAISERMPSQDKDGSEVLLIAPIYRAGWPVHSIDLRRRNITGFALGLIDVRSMINAAFRSHRNLLTPGGIDLYIFDDDKVIGDPLIYTHHSRVRSDDKAPNLNKALAELDLHVSDYVEIGSRNWLLVARPVHPKFGAGIPQSAWQILALGLLLTATVAFFLKSNIDRNRIVESQVIERTAEISAKNEQIKLMNDVTVAANEADTIEGATQACLDLMCQRTDWQIGHAYLVTSDGLEKLVPSDIWYFENPDKHARFKEARMQTEFESGEGLPGKVYFGRDVIWLTDELFDEKFGQKVSAEDGLFSAIGMPVTVEKEVVAVLEFFHDRHTKPDANLIQAMVHIGAQLGQVFERKKVESMKSDFIATVSHELRTPLTSIKGSLGLIMSGVTGDLPVGLKEMVHIAHSNSDRLVRLINDILDVEKIEGGKMELNLVPLDLAVLMKQIISENEGFADECNVTLSLSNEVESAKIFADSDRFIQAMTNLISNASKFSPENGTVRIEISNCENGYRISVADDGRGIPEKFRSKIFGKFAQADSSATRGHGGTGLGLNITKSIVEAHSGEIDFVCGENGGTTFFIVMPEFVEEEGTELSEQKMLKDQPQILVCEDDVDIAQLLQIMLTKSGFLVDIAYNAAEAKSALQNHSYDAMTLDLALPDQDGISLLQDIRQIEKIQNIPVVVVSATAGKGQKEFQGQGFGIIDWIQKPIDHDYLETALNRAISGQSDQRPQILHVEDDEDVASVVAKLLGDLATVTLARSLQEGKELLASKKFDLVVLDLMLPDGSGEELLSPADGEVKSLPPFIVFSAKETLMSDVSENINATLIKSRTSNEQLVETIRSAMEVV